MVEEFIVQEGNMVKGFAEKHWQADFLTPTPVLAV